MAAKFSTRPPVGRPFSKGEAKRRGRLPGVQNVCTRVVREAIALAAEGLGGVPRLITWAKEDPRNEFAFWTSIWPRLLPLTVQGTGARGEIEMSLKIDPGQLEAKLRERGLPGQIFGCDKPLLEIEARPLNGNGASKPDEWGKGDGA